MNITASQIKPMDVINGRRVQDAFTCGKKARTTSVHYYGGESEHLDPNQEVEVTRA